MKTVIALALVICQLLSPIGAVTAQAPAQLDYDNIDFFELLTIVGAAYEGGWYCGVNAALSESDDDYSIEDSYAEAAAAISELPAPLMAAIGFEILREFADSTGSDLIDLIDQTNDYSDTCFAAYMGYISGYSYGFDEVDLDDTSESFAWALEDVQTEGDNCQNLGEGVLALLDENNMIVAIEDYYYEDVCFGAGCSHNVGWSIGYDKFNLEEGAEYGSAELLESILWAANWVKEQEEEDINFEGQYVFESVYALMGNDVEGFDSMAFSIRDFFFACGVAGAAGLYEKLYEDADFTMITEELSAYSTNEIIMLGLDYFSQFFMAYTEGRAVC